MSLCAWWHTSARSTSRAKRPAQPVTCHAGYAAASVARGCSLRCMGLQPSLHAAAGGLQRAACGMQRAAGMGLQPAAHLVRLEVLCGLLPPTTRRPGLGVRGHARDLSLSTQVAAQAERLCGRATLRAARAAARRAALGPLGLGRLAHELGVAAGHEPQPTRVEGDEHVRVGLVDHEAPEGEQQRLQQVRVRVRVRGRGRGRVRVRGRVRAGSRS